MPQFIYKEAPDVDYYVVWSSVVDAPAFTGNREETLKHIAIGVDEWLREDAPHHPENRMARVDETGTSSMWIAHAGMRDRYPEDGAWDDDSHIYKQEGVLTRENLFKLCHRLDEDDNADVSDLLTPLDDAEAE